MPPSAQLRHVTLTFDDYRTRALHDLTLDLRPGEIHTVLGPANSGKTALLELLAGYLRPTEGTVRVFGRSPRSRPAQTRIGYIPQHGSSQPPTPGLLAWLNPFSPTRRPPSRPIPNQPPNAAQRRSLLAHALVKKSNLLLLDAPFADLEPAARADLEQLLTTLAAEGKTILLTARCLTEIHPRSHRLTLLHAGRHQATGTLAELLAHPDALRLLAPVLPPATAARLLAILRTDLPCAAVPDPHTATPVGHPLSHPPDPAKKSNLLHELTKPAAATATNGPSSNSHV